MRDRIRQIMESQHMTQQVFADFLGIGPATLSGIFNNRTKPTINIIEAIKKKLPNLNTDWLMFGTEPMYTDAGSATVPEASVSVQEGMLDFGHPIPQAAASDQNPLAGYQNGRNARLDVENIVMKNIDKPMRRVTEIRVFYDDQTWESFVPAKKS